MSTYLDEEHSIEDDDVVLDHIPDVAECRSLADKFRREQFWPNVWHVNDRGNVDLLSLDYHTGARIVLSWV